MIKSIGASKLTKYFEFLDGIRESDRTNMFGAGIYLLREYPGMAPIESRKVLAAWMETFSNAVPAEDRADMALDD